MIRRRNGTGVWKNVTSYRARGAGTRAEKRGWMRALQCELQCELLALLLLLSFSACATVPHVPIVGVVVDDKELPMDTVSITVKELLSDEEKAAAAGKELPECSQLTDAQGRYQCNSLEGKPFKTGHSYQLIIRKNAFKEGSFVIKFPPEGEFKTIMYDLSSPYTPDLGSSTEKTKRSGGTGPVI